MPRRARRAEQAPAAITVAPLLRRRSDTGSCPPVSGSVPEGGAGVLEHEATRRTVRVTVALLALALLATGSLAPSSHGDAVPAAREPSALLGTSLPAGTACPEPSVPLTAEILHGDVNADGCTEQVTWDGRHVTVHRGHGVTPGRFALEARGAQLLLGDWSCDGRATLALYRPATGQVFLFGGWPEPGAAASAAERQPRAARHGLAVVERASGCDRVDVRPAPVGRPRR